MHMDPHRRNHQLLIHSELDGRPFYEGWTGDQLGSTKKRTSSQSFALDENVLDAPSIQLRKLPPIRSVALQHAPQRAPPPHSTLPSSGPIKVKTLLNPEGKTGANGHQHNGEETDCPRTVPMAVTVSLLPTSTGKGSLGDGPLPSFSPTLMETYPSPLSQSPTAVTDLSRASIDTQQQHFVLPRYQASKSVEIAMAPSMPSKAHPSLPRPSRTSPPSALPQATPTSEPQSSFSAPFTFGEKWFDAPTSGAVSQSHYKTMAIETKRGLVELPVDVQAASKVADEKRMRNATASHRFRQRRKEKELETSSQIQELTEDRDFYQQRSEALWRVIQQNSIVMPPQPPSPGCRRQASLGVRLCQDNKASAPKQGKKRRTNAYAPPQAMPPMPSYIHTATMPSKHTSTTTDASVSAMPSLSQPFNAMAPRYIQQSTTIL